MTFTPRLLAIAMVPLLLTRISAAADAITENEAGQIEWKAGRLKEAERRFKHAKQIFENSGVTAGADYGAVLANLGALYYQRRQYKKAELLLRSALGIDEHALGPNHLRVAHDLNDLGALLQATGHYQAAQLFFLRALEIRECVLEPTHPDLLPLVSNLASLYCRSGMTREAELFYQRTLAILERGGEYSDIRLARALECYVELLKKRESYAEAESVQARATAIRVRNALKNSP